MLDDPDGDADLGNLVIAHPGDGGLLPGKVGCQSSLTPEVGVLLAGVTSGSDPQLPVEDQELARLRREDEAILSKAILGHSLHEVYSNKRIQLAVNRCSMERINCQLGSTEVSEIFSPERVATVCSRMGLVPGESMDIKSGYDFDTLADRKRCWESIIRDEPLLVIGSPPCTMFSRLQELNKYMYRNDDV